jgi:peptidylprolyl isomerase
MSALIVACLAASPAAAADAPAERGVVAGTAPTAAPAAAANALPPPPPDLAGPPPQANHSASGIAWILLAPGSGAERARPQDMVRYYHVAWTADGKVYDSALQRGRPASARVRAAVPGIREALGSMAVGEKRRLWIPASLAYRVRGEVDDDDAPTAAREHDEGRRASDRDDDAHHASRHEWGPGGLVVELELAGIRREPDPLPPPSDVAVPPKNAKRTDSGMAWRVLTHGEGTRHPLPSDTVEVVFTGWTPDGTMFVTSTTRPRPDAFRVDKCVAGWTEGLQLLVEGDHARFWIPGKLAYATEPESGPTGMVVFDIELVKIR